MAISIQINDDQFLDLFKKEYVGLSYQEFDLGKLDTRQGTFSNDFTIPNTAFNRSVLGYATQGNLINTTYTPYIGIPAKVFQNNIMISRGIIQITDDNKDEINVAYYGDNIDIFELLRGKKLRDIDLSDLRHTYTAANVTGSFDNTSGYIYLPIDYGLFTTRAGATIASGEIYPAVYLPDITTAIFKDLGYKVNGSILSRALFTKSAVPFGNNFFGYSKEFADSKGFYAFSTPYGRSPEVGFEIAAGATVRIDYVTISGAGQFMSGVTDSHLFNTTSDRYTADDDYQINVRLAYGQGRGGLNFPTKPTIDIRKNGVSIASTSTVQSIEIETTVATGDYLEAFITNNYGSPIKISSVFSGAVSQEFVAGSVIYLETVLPDMDQVDFIKWILFRFCGVLSIDQFSKTVSLNQFTDIKNNASDDWSNKIDLSKEIKTDYSNLLSGYAKVNIAKYTEDDNDIEQSKYNVDNELPFGAGQFVLDNDFVENERVIFETPFSGTLLLESFLNNKILVPYIPRHLEGETDINVPEPRILTVYGNLDMSFFSQVETMTILGTTVSSIPFSYFYKPALGTEVDDFKESLAFGTQNIGISNDRGAFDSDYLLLISILENPNVKHAYIKLNQIDLANLSFLKGKYFERFGAYFYLNIIDEYDASGDSVMCELIKI